jgi:type I protein arginine methyltransferase
MYSVVDYGDMIADTVRMDAFVAALRGAVTPGCVVVDIGTGTGIFALLACSLGARRVYAIEPNDTIEVARTIAAANGLSDRIEFHQAFSTEVTLPERADVIVADIGGALPWFQKSIPSIVDARRRLLAPHGILIPQQDTVWTAVVEAPEMYSRRAGPWRAPEFGLDMEAARQVAVNTWIRGRVSSNQLLAEPLRWATVDYRTIEESGVRATLNWVIERGGVGHGIVSGLDRIIAPDLFISNAPDRGSNPSLVYEPVCFPWTEPVPLERGDHVSEELSATLVGGEYVWSWKTRIRCGTTGAVKAAFTQSTFLSAPLSLDALRSQAPDYVPALTQNGHLTLLVLTLIAQRLPVGEIARQVLDTYSERFTCREDALAFVRDITRLYG